MATESPIDYWEHLALAADEGQLFLEAQAAHDCNKACDEYIDLLRTLKFDASALVDVQGMGDFASGIALARKFSEKAAGGANNLVDVLQSHIDVVMAMQAVFRKFIVDTESADQDNATSIGSRGPR